MGKVFPQFNDVGNMGTRTFIYKKFSHACNRTR